MDGFDLMSHCTSNTSPPHTCYSQFSESQIPNLAALATTFVVSDRTFEFRSTPSWTGHMVLASATLDGFQGDNPSRTIPGFGPKQGWGCDSNKEAPWGPSSIFAPSCIPDQQGKGPVVASPVQYVPTIFDRLDAAGRSWKIYYGSTVHGSSGYVWSICPYFYECLGGSQAGNVVFPAQSIESDAAAGTLPAYSIVVPGQVDSQHPRQSMLVGDNFIGEIVSSIENGPQRNSTAIFITYDGPSFSISNAQCVSDLGGPFQEESVSVPSKLLGLGSLHGGILAPTGFSGGESTGTGSIGQPIGVGNAAFEVGPSIGQWSGSSDTATFSIGRCQASSK